MKINDLTDVRVHPVKSPRRKREIMNISRDGENEERTWRTNIAEYAMRSVY